MSNVENLMAVKGRKKLMARGSLLPLQASSFGIAGLSARSPSPQLCSHYLRSPDSDGQLSQAKSVPALDPGRGLFRAKSPLPVSPTESAARVRSPSPPKIRSPVKVPERFKSPEPPRAALSPQPVMNSEREQNGVMSKSVANGTANGNFTPPGTSTNQMDTTDDQGLTRKKVVKVVRRVVRKVLPTEEDEATVPTQPSGKAPEAAKPDAEPVKAAPTPASVSKPPGISGFSFKHDVVKTEDKDDFSRGLANFMVRGRTRDPRPRIRKDERPEKLELEKKNEKKEEKIEPEEPKEQKKEDKTTLKPQEANQKPTSSGPVRQEVKTPGTAVNPTSTASSKSTHSRPTSLPPVVGFIPAPKPTPLAPPPGFIPAPRPASAAKLAPVKPPSATPAATKPTPANPPSTTPMATKPTPANPPSTAPLATKPSLANPPSTTPTATKPTPARPPSTTPVAPKSSPLSPPPRFTPAAKPSSLATPVSPDPPRPKPGPLSPPPGIIPTQQPAVRQQEETPLSPTEEAQRRLMRIFNAPVKHPAAHLHIFDVLSLSTPPPFSANTHSKSTL
ncbi:uncharacterized protein ABDE67_002232 [Symphorus nematophorus]